MNPENDDFENELMAEEDTLLEEMKIEFQKRLQERLRKKVRDRESEMPEVRRLKKNGVSRDDCDAPSEK